MEINQREDKFRVKGGCPMIISKLWRGDVPLKRIFWLYLVIGSFLFFITTIIINTTFLKIVDDQYINVIAGQLTLIPYFTYQIFISIATIKTAIQYKDSIIFRYASLFIAIFILIWSFIGIKNAALVAFGFYQLHLRFG